jgi:DNA-binding protein YbaB
MLEDLVLAAVNSALRAAQEAAAAENPMAGLQSMFPGFPR